MRSTVIQCRCSVLSETLGTRHFFRFRIYLHFGMIVQWSSSINVNLEQWPPAIYGQNSHAATHLNYKWPLTNNRPLSPICEHFTSVQIVRRVSSSDTWLKIFVPRFYVYMYIYLFLRIQIDRTCTHRKAWDFDSAAPLGNKAVCTMTWYPT